MTVQTKSLSDLQTQATMLNGLAEATAAIANDVQTVNSKASNGLYALLEVLVQKSDELARDLERLELEGRK
ncbi:hypothetical protein D1114_01815 [Cereibacter sphaeroides]|uniref:Uncharacterized protein n=1 Tax=Cereibacter sphaeroides TaxID=1063 RepID=A0AAX1URM0_CERSP|nr:hypothetical protein [Cereibacter sphaeroides]RHZ98847.1 hypothetical protein D1114_01815 [Cereibacter sphaeroides]